MNTERLERYTKMLEEKLAGLELENKELREQNNRLKAKTRAAKAATSGEVNKAANKPDEVQHA